MAKINSQVAYMNLLKKKAEKKIKARKEIISGKSNLKFNYELDLYKVELELQNEELILAENKLIQKVNEYTQLFENAPVGYIILDENGRIIKINDTASQLLGLNKKFISKKYFSTFILHKSSQDRFYKFKNLTLETKVKQQFECEIKTSDNNTFDAFIESKVLYNKKSEVKQLLCTIIDVSKQKSYEKNLKIALQKEKQLAELKSQFISIASHEFRTPLSIILTSAELIEKHNKFQFIEKQKNHLQKINYSVNRIKDVLNNFFTIEQIENKEKINSPKEINIVECINKLIYEINVLYESNNIIYSHKGKSSIVKLDENLFKTCLTNLIVNAIKYSEKKSPIKIKTIISNNKFNIKIIDTGIGIPKLNQTFLFDKFYRAGNVSNINGLGLGLHITKQILQIMGGEITFTSKENKGSTFTIIFPLSQKN